MKLPQLYDVFREKWEQFQTAHIISDTHFGDKDLQTSVKSRPSDEDYVKLINSKVGKNDLLICLGDIGNINCVNLLRGYKVLIAGNHDSGLSNYKRNIYTEIFDSDKYTKREVLNEMKYKYPNCIYNIEKGYDVCHSPFGYWRATADNKLFDEVYGGPLIISDKIILSHEPININWAMNIHGHNHNGNVMSDPNHYNVCGEPRGEYEPINFNRFIKTGLLSPIETIHRTTINKAVKRKRG